MPHSGNPSSGGFQLVVASGASYLTPRREDAAPRIAVQQPATVDPDRCSVSSFSKLNESVILTTQSSHVSDSIDCQRMSPVNMFRHDPILSGFRDTSCREHKKNSTWHRSALIASQQRAGRKTCHFCGHRFVGSSENVYCSNAFCDKSSSNVSLICDMCLTKQATYFESIGVDFRNVFGDFDSGIWYCMDCIVHDFSLVGIGLCCCSFRRHKLCCPIHPNEPVTSSIHCHAYRRKNANDLLDVSSIVDVRRICIPDLRGSVPDHERYRYRRLYPNEDALLLLQLTRPDTVPSIALASNDALINHQPLYPTRFNRRTCHFCGKEQRFSKDKTSSREDEAENCNSLNCHNETTDDREKASAVYHYCNNAYCDKQTGQAQYICGGCAAKQAHYFKEVVHLNPHDILGDVNSPDWFCLDCCKNDFALVHIGSCCCSFRRNGFKCPLHPIELPSGRRIHCHTYYQRLPKRSSGLKDVSDILRVENMHIPWNEEIQGHDTRMRSFKLVSMQNVHSQLARTTLEPSTESFRSFRPLIIQQLCSGTSSHTTAVSSRSSPSPVPKIPDSDTAAFSMSNSSSAHKQEQKRSIVVPVLGIICSSRVDDVDTKEHHLTVCEAWTRYSKSRSVGPVFHGRVTVPILTILTARHRPFVLYLAGASHRFPSDIEEDSYLHILDEPRSMWRPLNFNEWRLAISHRKGSCFTACIFANACHTSTLAQRLTATRSAPYCIGWSTRTTHRARITLAEAFFRSLARGLAIEPAFREAIAVLRQTGIVEGDPAHNRNAEGVAGIWTCKDCNFNNLPAA